MATSDNKSELNDALTGLNILAESGIEWAHCSDISNTLREMQKADIHWRRIQSVLDANRDLVSRRKRSHRWQYKLLETGRKTIVGGNDEVILVEPSKAVQSVVAFHDLLSNLKGKIQICDPYLDPKSIEHLDALPNSAQIRYLTHNIRSEGALRRTISAFSSAGRQIKVGRLPKAEIHDRYLIDKDQLIILGSSLNGFGKKQSFIISAGQDMRRVMIDHFDSCWSRAVIWT